ncbi:MAG: HD domain-containing protein [Oscillospiraceae bacterium]
MNITAHDVRESEEIRTYIARADSALLSLGYTEHSFAHVVSCAEEASSLLRNLGRDERQCELAWIAGYMHDIGNIVNRENHAHSGAVMAFTLLVGMGMNPLDVAEITAAIGNHDEYSASPVSDVAAALILADKTDVRRSRVRNCDTIKFDIHDRVNYAVEKSELRLELEVRTITLHLTIDTSISAVMDYFEIFLQRMLLSRKAAEKLDLVFELVINGQRLL